MSLVDQKGRELLRQQIEQADIAAGILRVALSVTGPLGAIVGEFATQMIPRQRLDRLGEFMAFLEERLVDHDEFRRRLETSPGFSALLEDATLAAVRTPFAEKRRRIAEVVKTGFSKADAEMLEQQALLELVAKINDIQVLMLVLRGGFKTTFGDPDKEKFLQEHWDVLVCTANMNASAEHHRRDAMTRHYEDELVSLGLLEAESVELGSRTRPRLEITSIGILLLRAIGHPTPGPSGV